MKNFKTKLLVVAVVVGLGIITVSASVYNLRPTEAIVENNGYYGCDGEFDKEMTPATNMLIILKIINGSNFCDNDWYREVQECQGMLNAQIEKNRYSKDPYVQKMMKLQQDIVRKLQSFSTSAWVTMLSSQDVDELQKAYNAYHDYYYENYPEREEL